MPTTTTADAAGNRPVQEIRHRNIRATIWRNEADKGGTFYNVSVSRSYKDAEGQWHDTNSFGFGDLMNLAKALYDAHSAIAAAMAKDKPARPGTRRETRAR